MKRNFLLLLLLAIFILVAAGLLARCRAAHEYLTPAARIYSAKEAQQGVAVDKKYFYAIADNQIGKYLRKNGKRVLSRKLPFKHLNGGKIIGSDLVLCSNPQNGTNTVVWVNPRKLQVIDQLRVPVPGSLTWVDYADNKWWVCSAYYKKQVKKTRILCFNTDWIQEGDWKLPKKVVESIKPWSLSGGAWMGRALFVSGHDKPELYALSLAAEATHAKLIKTVPVCFNGQGFSFDSSGAVWGIRRADSVVVTCKLK